MTMVLLATFVVDAVADDDDSIGKLVKPFFIAERALFMYFL